MKILTLFAIALFISGNAVCASPSSESIQEQLTLLRLKLSRLPQTVIVVRRTPPPAFIDGESPSDRGQRIAKALENAQELWRAEWSAQNPFKYSGGAPAMPDEWREEAIRKSNEEAAASSVAKAAPTQVTTTRPNPEIAALRKRIAVLEKQLRAIAAAKDKPHP